jgi:hypothetical protein
MRISCVLTFGLVLTAACSKPPAAPPSTTPEPGDEGVPGPGVEERPGLTAQACEAEGGQVVGDIGDGAIHRPDYRCPDSGEAPLGSIVADPSGPVAVEGAVCCM